MKEQSCSLCGALNPADATVCEICKERLGYTGDDGETVLGLPPEEDSFPGESKASRYEIKDKLGKGGMGTVYRARDKDLDVLVALKVIHPYLTTHKEAMERFRSEIRTCLSLTHVNIVRVHDLTTALDNPGFSMEYIDGKSLRQHLMDRDGKKPPFTLKETATVMIPVLNALGYAHTKTVHRDIKPENIMLEGDFPNPTVKVLDFGIAKTLSHSRLTTTAHRMGTAYYMAPEQLQGKDVDHRADLYSVGMVMYEMLTGEMAVGRFSLPGELYPKLPEEIDTVVETLLKPKPEGRYPNARETALAIKEVAQKPVPPPVPAEEADKPEPPLEEKPENKETAPTPKKKPVTPKAKPAPAKGRSKWGAVLAVMLLFVFAGLGGAYYFNQEKGSDPGLIVESEQDSVNTADATPPVVALPPPPPEPAVLRVDVTPPEAEISFAESDLVFTQGMELNAGEYTVQASLDGYKKNGAICVIEAG